MDGTSLSTAANTIASLLVILFVLAAAAYALRRFGNRQTGATTTTQSSISIISTRPLGGQLSLVITEAEGARFLIAISRTGITTIGRLNPPELNQ
jgi:flagellar biogenesis protein FliO